jgi:hypothetical protein
LPSVSIGQKKDTWNTFSTKDGGATFSMPCKSLSVSQTPTKQIIYACLSNKRGYIVTYNPFHYTPVGDEKIDAREKPKNFSTYFVFLGSSRINDGKLLSDKNLSTSDVLGYEYVIQMSDGTEHGKLFGVKYKAVYSIAGFVENGKGTSKPAEITKFLNSFKLNR